MVGHNSGFEFGPVGLLVAAVAVIDVVAGTVRVVAAVIGAGTGPLFAAFGDAAPSMPVGPPARLDIEVDP
jgi:hypothetical protein